LLLLLYYLAQDSNWQKYTLLNYNSNYSQRATSVTDNRLTGDRPRYAEMGSLYGRNQMTARHGQGPP